MRKYFLFTLALLLSASVFSQDKTLYTIQVGTFLDAKLIDFEAIKSYGYVYANELGGNTYSVYVGRYEKEAEAKSVLEKIKNKGYSNAFLQKRYTAEGQDMVVIQLATKSSLKPIDWNTYIGAGDLYALLIGNQLKITTGFFRDINEAKQSLGKYRSKYKGAFVKKINSTYLHQVSQFETGIKQDLIPLALDQSSKNANRNTSQEGVRNDRAPDSYNDIPIAYDIPTSYEDLTAKSPERKTVASKKSVAKTSLPSIRGKVKRTSALELQKVLKAERAYDGSLDGYYGKGTRQAFEDAVQNNREYQKYSLLAEYMDPAGGGFSSDDLQQAINNLPYDQNAQQLIENSETPIGLAYRAYLVFTNYGPGGEVNDLMNSSIQAAYAGKQMKNRPPFDYRATYAYKDLSQLILHLHYIHGSPGNRYSAPCWLFQVHPGETAQAYESMAAFSNSNIRMQACDEFLSWEDLRIAQAIAADLNSGDADAGALAQAASLRAKLYLAPRALTSAEKKSVENWNRNLWNGLNGWGSRDPLHQKILTAFKISFFQSQVLLEDHYMDKGFKAPKAKELALATLQTLVGAHLERFI